MEQEYTEEILQLFDDMEDSAFKETLLSYHPYELSEALLLLDEQERLTLYKILTPEEISPMMSYLDVDELLELFNEMIPKYIVGIIQYLDVDDAVDIMQELPEEERAGYLKLMTKEHRDEIKDLFRYKEDTAGSIMTTDFVEIDVKDTVEQAMKKLIAQAVDAETIDTIYVVDSKDKLVGVLALRELILARKGQKIEDIMNERIVWVHSSTDQEDVAVVFKDYDFTTVPVVDHLDRMLGIITIDDIVDVIDEEAAEDYAKFAGISNAEFDSETETIWMSSKKRIPWLLALSLLGFLTSTIIARYESTVSAVPTIALFMPMILGMAGNTGTQALAVTVRALNSGEFHDRNIIMKHLLRELGTGLLNGVFLAIALFGITYGFLSFTNNPDAFKITQVVSLSILVGLTISTFAGAFIPIIINSMKIDPAIASGPFVTVINDILGLSIYFTLATILIINTL
jgi:magnesium transporter